jgi:hypothetical protein
MWGQSGFSTSGSLSFRDDPSVKWRVVRDTVTTGYQLLGRSTWRADVKRVEPLEETRFLKISWPEVQRVPEAEVIRTARKRVEEFDERVEDGDEAAKDGRAQLEDSDGETIKDMVHHHLPVVYDSQDYGDTSTASIRHLLGLETKGSRTLQVICFKKLDPITTLHPDKLWKAFWEAVRCACSYLLICVCPRRLIILALIFRPRYSLCPWRMPW